uniref:Uncharacterized protein n=1 Tax=Anguilla anguilla TaxID=7936 RepID=A0A0E9Q999_ANGAN
MKQEGDDLSLQITSCLLKQAKSTNPSTQYNRFF